MKQIKAIEQIVCAKYDTEPEELHFKDDRSKSHSKKGRKGIVPLVRQIIIYYALKEGYTQEVAAGYFNRDHATAFYAKEKVNSLILFNKAFADQIKELDFQIRECSSISKVIEINELLDQVIQKVNYLKTELKTVNL